MKNLKQYCRSICKWMDKSTPPPHKTIKKTILTLLEYDVHKGIVNGYL